MNYFSLHSSIGVRRLAIPFLLLVGMCGTATAQSTDGEDTVPAAAAVAPNTVEVRPVAADEEIEERLTRILEATQWFDQPDVRVSEGVVFLEGATADERHRVWAGDLARNTRDVVAVVNRIDLIEPSPWNFQPALQELRDLWRSLLKFLPGLMLGLLILVVGFFAARWATRGLRRHARQRFKTPLLREVAARAAGLLVFVLGLYLALQIAGLTRLAVTVVGGTGLLGLIIGIAFRDITENFLASILLSMQQPFRIGDRVEIDDTIGIVQRVTVRTSILMMMDGNHVQIPNSVVYKSTIRNFTSNPNIRQDFVVGIGYDDSVSQAQQVALDVVQDHPAVLADPEPWVLVDDLGPSTVNLRVYFWLDGSKHSPIKVRSSVIRLVKRALQNAGVSMPDESRELIFPQGVPLRWLAQEVPVDAELPRPRLSSTASHESSDIASEAEEDLSSESKQIEQQARRSRLPEEGENLLDRDASVPGFPASKDI